MKRVLFTVAGTVLGLVGLLSFKSHGSPLAAAGGLANGAQPGSGVQPPGGIGPTRAHHVPRAGSRHRPTRSSSSGTSASSTVLGNAEQTPYGVVQVRVTVDGSRITKVTYAQLTAYDGTSQQINNYVAPILVRQTLQAQSANIHGVSGASYTSAGYARSLQSALDHVH